MYGMYTIFVHACCSRLCPFTNFSQIRARFYCSILCFNNLNLRNVVHDNIESYFMILELLHQNVMYGFHLVYLFVVSKNKHLQQDKAYHCAMFSVTLSNRRTEDLASTTFELSQVCTAYAWRKIYSFKFSDDRCIAFSLCN